MTDQQFTDLISEIRALTTQVKWILDDIEVIKEKLEDLEMNAGSNAQAPKQTNWRREDF